MNKDSAEVNREMIRNSMLKLPTKKTVIAPEEDVRHSMAS